ncbi:SDR family oxidoreductase [Micromonospora sp. URMC 103]|uniref:SDR family oxidoreductase n=1 Tax=Micromonospora sp. URMC 103 TaxID=3423406 RepID=UPI003F1B3832
MGYLATVHVVRSRLAPHAAVLVFGGGARYRPYPGSTTVSTINGGAEGMTRTLGVELAPVRVNSLHSGMVVDSPFWQDKPQVQENARLRTLTGRLPTSADVVDAAVFLLENPAVNGVDLRVDGGWRER